MPLDVERVTYKPFEYPWAYEAWKAQQSLHWMADEVPLQDDVQDWNRRLSGGERNLVTQIFRFFTQSDVEVNNVYTKIYSQVFKPVEVVMALSAFSNIETVHVDAYSQLLDTIGMPEVEYAAFLEYGAMKEKFDFMRSYQNRMPNNFELAETLAVFGAFTEGLQLFASFAILLNFPRFNKLKGMGQIVTYSARDETIHALTLIRIFHLWLEEHPEIDRQALAKRIYEVAPEIVAGEDAFIDLAFELGDVEGLKASEVKAYIRFMCDVRLKQLGLNPIYGIEENPLPWMDAILNGVEFAAFFEGRATEYSKGITQGSWADVQY